MESATITKRKLVAVASAASVGSYFEYYDFFIALLAATVVWPTVFFKGQTASTAISLSILSYALTFFSRPVGAFIFGHMGDTGGRKQVLYWTMVLMAVGTFGVAALPGAVTLGAGAPILLGVLRLVQGLGLGGNTGGAATWVVEMGSKSNRRGWWSSWVQQGSPLGLTTAAGLSYLLETFTGTAYVAWTWRIPFVIGGVVAVVGVLIRYRLGESRTFEKLKQKKKTSKMPAVEVFRKHWKVMLLLSFVAFPEIIGTSFVVVPFSIVYMAQLGIPRSFTTFIPIMMGVGAFIGSIIAGVLTDKVGRRLFAIAAAVFAIIVVIPLFLVYTTKSVYLIAFMLLFWGAGVYLENGILPAFFAESFPTKFRDSGSGLSLQFGTLWSGLLVGFVLPVILTSSGGHYANAWPYIAAVTMATAAIALGASAVLKETKDVDVDASEEDVEMPMAPSEAAPE